MKMLAEEKLVRLLREMPAWADVHVGAAKALVVIEDAVRKFGSFDLDTIMAGIRLFVAEDHRASNSGSATSELSKIFVLNRYVFDVPEFTPLDQPRFGGFIGVPVKGDQTNELWPWKIYSKNEICLKNYFRGYSGEIFLALEEAEAFRERYGLRRQELKSMRGELRNA